MAFGASGDSSLSLARANGKSTFVAALGCAFLDGPLRQPRAEVVIVASSFLQARIVFDHLLGFMGERVAGSQGVAAVGFDPIGSTASPAHRRVRALHRVRSQAYARTSARSWSWPKPAQWGGSTSEASLGGAQDGARQDSRLETYRARDPAGQMTAIGSLGCWPVIGL